MTEEQARILVVEDERGMRATLVGTLEDQGYRLTGCETGREAIEAIRTSPPDVVVCDLRLPDADGLTILQSLRETNPEAAFILVTGYASVDTAVDALNEGAYAYITKPFNMDEVNSTIGNALKQQRLVRENARLVESLQSANKDLNLEVSQRTRAEEALQDSLKRMKIAYDQATIYAQELREEIDQREKAEEALVRSEELRRRQAAQEAREQERKRLAEELHDETMAELASVVVDLGFFTRHSGPLPLELDEGLGELRTRVRDSERNLRQIVSGIFPSLLTNLGLVSALRSHFDDLAGRPSPGSGPMEIVLAAAGLDDGRLPEDVEIAAYRVVQQAVTNAIQHAHASKMEVELTWKGAELQLGIADDGVGFDVERLDRTGASGHFGLINLRDRIEGLNGAIEINSKESAGTKIRATVPTATVSSGSGQLHTAVFLLGGEHQPVSEGE